MNSTLTYDVSESVLATGMTPHKLNITLILIPLCIVVICAAAGFAGICMLLKLNLIRKQQNETSISANEVNQTYYEIIDPIYEAIPATESEKSTQINFGITMMSNDAYSQETNLKCCHSQALDFNTSSNEAYLSNEKLMSMQNNSSYQAATLVQCNNPMTVTAITVTVAESEGPTKEHQCYEKQSTCMENIQQADILCSSVKCVSPKHAFKQN